MKTFSKTHWGSTRQFQLPCHLFQPKISLPPYALAVLLVLYELARMRVNPKALEGPAEVLIKQKLIVERTGLSKNSVSKAIRELDAQKFIKIESQRKKRGEFGVNRYLICDPSMG